LQLIDMNKGLSRGLESVALALIFAPEPVTTFVGIGLLAATRATKVNRVASTPSARPSDRFEDLYNYRIVRTTRNSLAYRVAPLRDGSMPHAPSQRVKLYETGAWHNYRNNAYSYLSQRNPQQENFRGIQRGLLQDVKKNSRHPANRNNNYTNTFTASPKAQRNKR